MSQAKRMKALEDSYKTDDEKKNINAAEEDDEAAAAAAAAAALALSEGNNWDAGAVAESFQSKLPLADRIRLKLRLGADEAMVAARALLALLREEFRKRLQEVRGDAIPI